MKKNYLILFLMTMMSFGLFAQDVNISDANFLKALIKKEVDKNNDGKIQVIEAESVTSLDIQSLNIENLTGIEAFTNLTYLLCYNNKLKKLDVSKNTKLTDLICNSNQLTNLDVSENTALTYLHCSNNPLTSNLDVSQNTALTTLYCYENKLTSLDVSKNNSLTGLLCNNNPLKNLNINGATALKRLDCNYNLLSSLDVSGAIALTDLSCENNKLTSLDVSKNIALTDLSCENNKLTSLDVSKNIALTDLDCYGNQLTSLDVSKNIALTDLHCSNNPLTSNLDVSKNTALTFLYCHGNQLTSLDVSKNIALRILYCSNNPNLKCLSYLPNTLIIINIDSTLIECVANKPSGVQDDLKDVTLCNATNNKNSCSVLPQITGNVYVDLDLNQQKGAFENGYQGIKLITSPQNHTFYTDNNGDYSIALKDTGNYKLSIDNPLYYDAMPNEINGNLSSYTAIDTHLVALQANQNVNDLVVQISSFTRARPGFKMIYFVDYWNKGTQTIDDTEVKFVMPSAFTLGDSSNVSINQDTLAYKVGPLSPGKHGQICIHGKTQLETLGFEQKATISIYDVADLSEETLMNNYDTINYVVTGSYDPNDKLTVETITPKEVQAGTFLDYRIRFQNTGTDTAFTVVVTDTLSPLLNLSTLEILSSSHTMTSTLENNVLVMTFNNILLADSTTNEVESHGYIFYKIQPLKTLKLNDEIKNTANIYFDFNKPIITNTTITTVKELPIVTNNHSAKITNSVVYPNPAKNFVKISISIEKGSMKIFNTMGDEQEVRWISDDILSVTHLAKGIYTLQFTTSKGDVITSQLLIVD